jgi:hypothetical protein
LLNDVLQFAHNIHNFKFIILIFTKTEILSFIFVAILPCSVPLFSVFHLHIQAPSLMTRIAEVAVLGKATVELAEDGAVIFLEN